MSAFAHPTLSLPVRPLVGARERTEPPDPLWLRPVAGGWSLVDCDGALLWSCEGRTGRHRCLQRAYEMGVLTVLR